MKYKIIGLTACLFMLITVLVVPRLFHPSSRRYHQHREAPVPINYTADISEEFSTHLPLLILDTQGEMIPGRPIRNVDSDHVEYEVGPNGNTNVIAQLSVIDKENVMHHPTDTPSMTSQAAIHIRGHSSRDFDKPSYAIRLQKEDGNNNPLPLLGMDPHHEWVLHGPYLDKTLMQNYMWYNIAGEIMSYAPNVRFCELILNGTYQGVYVLTERITSSKDGRLSISASKKHNTFSGYLLRLDRGDSNPLKDIDPFSQYTLRAATLFNIEYPGTKNLSQKLQHSITLDFSKFEKSLYSYDFADPKYGYSSQIDINSFVDYFLINELTCNYDAGSLSTYIYKDLSQKFRLCVWDFNNACDNYQERSMQNPPHFELQNGLWFEMLFKDAAFTDRVIQRYRLLRKSVFSDQYLDNYIDEVVAYLGPAIDRNYEKWGYSFAPKKDLLFPSYRNPRSYQEAIQDMKKFLHQRTAWMDENIESLRQYSADSRIKSFKAVID